MTKFIYRVVSVGLAVWFGKLLAGEVRKARDFERRNRRVDETMADSFPSSDPPSSWAGA